MKWLVLSLPENIDRVGSVVSFIQQQGVECVLHTVSFDKINSSIDKCDKVCLQTITNLLKTASHCIFLDIGMFLHSSTLLYVIGVLAGRQIPVFITGKRAELSSVLIGENFKMLGKTEDLPKVLKEYFATYINDEVMQRALEKINKRSLPFTSDAFIQVIENSDLETAQIFLDAGMDINAKNSGGIPALSIAVRNKNIKTVKWLLEKGAFVNCTADDRGYSPVMDAVWKSDYKLTTILIDAGAVLDVVGKDSQTILGLAVGAENEDICRLLYESGANPDEKDGMQMSARDYARLFKKERLLSIFNNKREDK
ncbi:MAG TPA: ankyrin repeat domain-containing protein [Treponemataceae bacterium]|nr:ankyrin repeat domain-containing protein [Treponemataceae bacterium]